MLTGGILIGILTFTDWFHDQHFRTDFWKFLVPLVGVFISTLLGIFRTEDLQHLSFNDTPYTEGYTYTYVFYDNMPYVAELAVDVLDTSGGVSIPSCDDCGSVLVLLFIIGVTLLLVTGSAFIPNFWVFAGIAFVCLLGVITIRELRVRGRAYSAYPY